MANQTNYSGSNSDISLPNYTELGVALSQMESFISNMREVASHIESFDSEGLDLNNLDSDVINIKTSIKKLLNDDSEISKVHQSLKDTIYLLTGISQEMQEQYGGLLSIFLIQSAGISQDEMFEIANEHAGELSKYQAEFNDVMGKIKTINIETTLAAASVKDERSSAYYQQFVQEQNKKLAPLYQQRDELYQLMYITKGFYELSTNMAYNMYMQSSDFKENSKSSIANYEIKYQEGSGWGLDSENYGGYSYYAFTDKDGKQLSPSILEQAIYLYKNKKDLNDPAGATAGKTLNDYYYNVMPYLNENEIKIMTYLLNSGDQEKLDKYVNLKMDEAAQRHGYEQASKTIEKINGYYAGVADGKNSTIPYVKTLALLTKEGFFNGLKTFATGIDNLFNADGKVSYDQYETMYLTGYLQDKYGQDKFAGMVATGTFEIISSIGNMAPSMLVSMIPGCQWVGLSMMGLSAAGNAREEGLQRGMSEGESWAYGILSGASEVVLEKFLGAIPGLSDMEKFANLGGLKGLFAKMASEGLEESTQEVLDPLFATIVTRGRIPYEVNGEDVLKAGIYGAITAGILGGGENCIKMTVEGVSFEIAYTNIDTLIEEFKGQDLTDPQTKERLVRRLTEMDTSNANSGLNITEDQLTDLVTEATETELSKQDIKSKLKQIKKGNTETGKQQLLTKEETEQAGSLTEKIKDSLKSIKDLFTTLPTQEVFEDIADDRIIPPKYKGYIMLAYPELAKKYRSHFHFNGEISGKSFDDFIKQGYESRTITLKEIMPYYIEEIVVAGWGDDPGRIGFGTTEVNIADTYRKVKERLPGLAEKYLAHFDAMDEIKFETFEEFLKQGYKSKAISLKETVDSISNKFISVTDIFEYNSEEFKIISDYKIVEKVEPELAEKYISHFDAMDEITYESIGDYVRKENLLYPLYSKDSKLFRDTTFMRQLISSDYRYIIYDKTNSDALYIDFIDEIIKSPSYITNEGRVELLNRLKEELSHPRYPERGKYKIPHAYLFESIRKGVISDIIENNQSASLFASITAYLSNDCNYSYEYGKKMEELYDDPNLNLYIAGVTSLDKVFQQGYQVNYSGNLSYNFWSVHSIDGSFMSLFMKTPYGRNHLVFAAVPKSDTEILGSDGEVGRYCITDNNWYAYKTYLLPKYIVGGAKFDNGDFIYIPNPLLDSQKILYKNTGSATHNYVYFDEAIDEISRNNIIETNVER